MKLFINHTLESAPEGSRETIAATQKAIGFLPNLYGTMAGAPSLLNAYSAVASAFGETSLSSVEQQVVALTISELNECRYCMAAHSGLATAAGISESDLAALRSGRTLETPKLEALRSFTRSMVESRGWVSEKDIDAFLVAGFTTTQILEVIVGIAMKTMSNFTNHIADVPLDSQFEAFEWQPAALPKAPVALTVG